MPIKGLEKGDGVWGRGKEPFLKKVFPSSPRLPYQPLSGQSIRQKSFAADVQPELHFKLHLLEFYIFYFNNSSSLIHHIQSYGSNFAKFFPLRIFGGFYSYCAVNIITL